jgi:very-short-patch-repair endonuclease
MLSSYESEHEKWYKDHCSRRKGERLRRLQHGHGHAERLFLQQVWYPAFRSFEQLHPEYEVNDFRDGRRYLDFAYIVRPLYLCLEIDGYGPHSRDADRRQFAEQLLRQNHLVVDGWRVLRFAYDDVRDKPRMCQQLIQQLIGRVLGQTAVSPQSGLTPDEKEIVRHLLRKQGPITPQEAAGLMQSGVKKARKSLRALVDRRLLTPDSGRGGRKRIHAYRLLHSEVEHLL